MRNRILRPLFAIVLLSTLRSNPAAQAPPPPQAPATADLSQEAAVIVRLAVTTTFDRQGTATRDGDVRVRVQNAGALKEAGTVAIPYSRELDTLDVRYVRVRKPNGTVIETPVSSAIEVPAEITTAAPMYSDVYLRNINVQGLEVGDTVEYATHLVERSILPGHFWMSHNWNDDAVVLDEDIRVSVPDDVAVTVKSPEAAPVVTTEGGRRTYAWRHATPKRLTPKELAERAYAVRDRAADIQITSFKDWAAVGDAVRVLWRGRADVTPAIQEKARELTRSAKSDREKLAAVFNYVGTKVRYIGISLGVGRIQPHTAAEVLSNGFGDCKDKHTLLVALLQAVGLESHAALIAPGSRLDVDVPSMAQFNHVITFVPGVDGGTWMDATMEVAPPGFLASAESDQQVLRIPAAGAAALIKTPASFARGNEWTIDVRGSLDATGTLVAAVTETYSGDSEIGLRQVFRAVPQSRWPEFAPQLPLPSRFGGKATDLKVSDAEDTSAPFRLTYTYTDDKFSEFSDQEISAALPWMRLPQAPDDTAPAVPLPFSVASRLRATSRIEMPDGFDVALKPGTMADVAMSNAFIEYHLTNTLMGHVYTAERTVTTKLKEIAVDQFGSYRDFLKALDDSKHAVTLRAIKPWAFGDNATIDWYAGSAATVSTMGAVVTASNRKDHENAKSLIDGLARAEPENASVGVLAGWVQIQAGDTNGGLQRIRAQMVRTPSLSGYKMLATRLASAGRRDEAVQAWQRGLELFPDDRECPLYLGEALLNVSQYGQAITVFRTQLEKQAGSPRLFFDLGKAYAGAADVPAAIAAFKTAATNDSSAFALNNIAWEMALAKVGLDDARDYAERAVASTEADAAKLTLTTLDAPGLRVMRDLAAHWDTLSLAQFRGGDLAGAERTQAAAWDLAQQGQFAERLAEIYEARGNRDAAAQFYALALAGDEPDARAAGHLLSIAPDPRARAALVSTAPATVVSGRTVSVPRIPGVTGAAQIFVRVGADGVVDDVRFVSGDTSMRPAAEMVRAAKMPSRLPAGSAAKLVRRGTLTCTGDAPTCSFVLIPASAVTSVN
ncbi:MAG: DUF3857 domain-containing protein [Acidobacteriota bacterium]